MQLYSTNGVSVTFVYVDATQGWIVTDSGNRSDLPTPEYIVATGGTVTCCGRLQNSYFYRTRNFYSLFCW
jgi:hypothetical protein